MTATGHAVVGVVIAAKFSNPFIAIPIAVLSHILCDIFPHWDFGTHWLTKTNRRLFYEALFDVIMSFIVAYLLFIYVFPQTNLIYGFIIVLAAQSLDYLAAPYYMFHIKVPPFSWVYNLSVLTNNPLDKPWGMINQVTVLVLLVLLAVIL